MEEIVMKIRSLLSVSLAMAMAFSLMPYAAAVAQTNPPAYHMQQLTSRGTTSIGKPAPSAPASAEPLSQEHLPRQRVNLPIPRLPAGNHPLPALSVPQVNGDPIAGATHSGFTGLNHYDQRNAGTGEYTNTQFSLEPPDQGLCVGNGFVLETINTALAVYDQSGALLAGPTALNQFYNLAPEIDRNTLTYGDFTSDPRCYYDSQTGHWFMTILQISVDPTTGAFMKPTHTEIAVSQTNDPTAGWNLFSLDTTDDGSNGTPDHPGCSSGCFGDQPLIGADANGFYITTNEFNLAGTAFNGAQVYAMSKSELAAGSMPVVVHLDNLLLAEGMAYSIQPATSPAQQYDQRQNGTEYFLSALDFTGTLDNRVAVWALVNTGSLNDATPQVTLSSNVLTSEVYGQPPVASQKPGATPLRYCMKVDCLGVGQTYNDPLAQLNTNDDRMNQVVFAHGLLWSGVNTILSVDGETHAGIAYFEVKPTWSQRALVGVMHKQGYVAVSGNDVLFPAIGVNDNGNGVMVFTLAGADYYPTAAVVTMRGQLRLHLAGIGLGPEDGFTAYQYFGGNGVARWGDYSAAVADGNTVWLATEYIPALCKSLDCGTNRTTYANWGTFISNVTP
jgi:hypothetical protein